MNTDSAQGLQKVHSKVQIIASGLSGGKSVSQDSHPGLSSNMGLSAPEADNQFKKLRVEISQGTPELLQFGSGGMYLKPGQIGYL